MTTSKHVNSTIRRTSDLTDADYERAIGVMVRHKYVSTSLVQRELGLGYNAAAKLVERAEADGIVTRPNEVGKRSLAAIQPDPEPQPVAWIHTMHYEAGCGENVAVTLDPDHPFGTPGRDFSEDYAITSQPLYATPSSAGMVSVEAAARVLLDQPYSVMVKAFDAMESMQGEGEDRIMNAALRALGGERG